MGDVINTNRFPPRRTSKERERMRAKFARRPMSTTRRRDVELPPRVEKRR